MKDAPCVKRKPLAPDEVRVINVDSLAIKELLFENLIQNKKNYFDVEDSSGDELCIMNWDQQAGTLTYAIMPMKYCLDGYELDFDYIRSKLGITANSLFAANRYQSIAITEQSVVQRKKP